MKGIGGNLTALIQTAVSSKNAIGETVRVWEDRQRLRGWLDLSGGDSKYTTFHAKLQESTHVFLADFVPLDGIQPENSRMRIGERVYDILLIDNPMELGSGSQWEIYLRYTGGQEGCP